MTRAQHFLWPSIIDPNLVLKSLAPDPPSHPELQFQLSREEPDMHI